MTGSDMAPILVSWVLIAVLGVATAAGLEGLHRERPSNKP
jgi:hypothetical protein